jgi:hypothetical protein
MPQTQIRCPPTDEWIKKCGTSTQKIVSNSLKKKNLSSVTTWLELEITMLSETQIPHHLNHIWNQKD